METNVITEAEKKPVEVGTEFLLRYNGSKDVHLQAWMVQNEPSDTMKYKDSYWSQTVFIRDHFGYLMFPNLIESLSVISTHTSKSVKLPVYYIKFKNEMEFIIRGNFHDWKISITSPFDLSFPEELVGKPKEKISGCYCEGFDKSWIYDSYTDNKRKFTLELNYCEHEFYALLLFIKMRINEVTRQNMLSH